MKDKILKLRGQVQHYAWGGYDFIPSLLNIDNSAQRPYAEYWLGTYPLGSSMVETEDGEQGWAELIKADPIKHLGEDVYKRFGELPYLLKILDVREMLSIQVHPTKEGAEEGYDREHNEGVAIDAAHRNYKDRNHKPEMLIALDEFWLLHGFRSESEVKQLLSNVPELGFLLPTFEAGGYKGLYKEVMEMPQQQVDEVLRPLVEREICNCYEKDQPGYWLAKLYKDAPVKDIDRGIFSLYLMHLVKLQKGEGIFQQAGVPHAYLEGQNIELMANSDNVLRGGFTPKHIDVQELLKHIEFKATEPVVLTPTESAEGILNYDVHVPDFGIGVLPLANGREYVGKSDSAEIFLVMEGQNSGVRGTAKRAEPSGLP